MDLNKGALGLSLGIVWGLLIFAMTIVDLFRGAGQTLILLSYIYRGYSISFTGAFIGLVWGFVTGLLFGYIVACLYNAMSGRLVKSKA